MKSAGSSFVNEIMKKYKKAGKYAYPGVSLVFLLSEKETVPVKSEVSTIYHLLLQEIYYKYYNHISVNRKEILASIEQSIEQHLNQLKRREPQKFEELHGFYCEMKHAVKGENLQKIEEQIREKAGITIKEINGIAEYTEKEPEPTIVEQKNIETIQGKKISGEQQPLFLIVHEKNNPEELLQSGTREYFTTLIQENSIEENKTFYRFLQNYILQENQKETISEENEKEFSEESEETFGKRLQNVLFRQITELPKEKIEQLILKVQEVFTITKKADFQTVKPGMVSTEKIASVSALPVNRFSEDISTQSESQILYKIQEKFLHQLDRVKQMTNLTGQEPETQRQVLLSIVRTATQEEQKEFYQYFDRNHLIYTDKEQTTEGIAQIYKSAELLQLICNMDIEEIRKLTDKWEREEVTQQSIEKETLLQQKITNQMEIQQEVVQQKMIQQSAVQKEVIQQQKIAQQKMIQQQNTAQQEIIQRQEAVLQKVIQQQNITQQETIPKQETTLQKVIQQQNITQQETIPKQETALQKVIQQQNITQQEMISQQETALQKVIQQQDITQQETIPKQEMALQKVIQQQNITQQEIMQQEAVQNIKMPEQDLLYPVQLM